MSVPEPSPYCGRMDEHDPHQWTTPWLWKRPPYECPGDRRGTKAEQGPQHR